MAGAERRRLERLVREDDFTAPTISEGVAPAGSTRSESAVLADNLFSIPDNELVETMIAGFAKWLTQRRILFGLFRRPVADRLSLLELAARDHRFVGVLPTEILHHLAHRWTLFGLARRSRTSAELVVSRMINQSLQISGVAGTATSFSMLFNPRRAAAYVNPDRMHPDRENVILVLHQASRTGAPILGWNIASHLAQHYNLFTVLLAGGPLVEAFAELSAEVHGPFVHGRPYPADIEHTLREMLNGRTFKYAIINSCESRAAAAVFSRRRIPTVLLMHEFASYVFPPSELRTLFDQVDTVVFPAEMVAESSRALHPSLNRRAVHILPQGLSQLPPSSAGLNRAASSLVRELATARSRGEFLVLGAGTVEFRKGVDVFLSTAAAVAREPGGERVRFLWVGRGYKPKDDMGYSIYLQEQITRAGLEDRVSFLDETPQLEPIYDLADALLLSSRLDPMPNVAIDAAWRGIPVVCFNRASGFADLMLQDPLTETGVADYLDPAAAARAILALARYDKHRAEVSAATMRLARSVFDMQAYVDALDALGSGVNSEGGRKRRYAS